MFIDILELILAVVAILLCAELFTNGIEWFGHAFKFSERLTGSVLAAVGTSLPETVVPFVAVLGFKHLHGNEVSIGAIAGAPFMLVTLAFATCGSAIWLRNKGLPQRLDLDSSVIARNLQVFLVLYAAGVAATFLPDSSPWRYAIALWAVLIYPVYVWRSAAQPATSAGHPQKLYLSKLLLQESGHMILIILQLLAGIAGIICGAYFFVERLQALAGHFHVSAWLMSLIITPIATELPEQATSVVWASRGKNTLALGNISGSMVFQSCFPVAFGVACTPWNLNTPILSTALVSLALAAIYMVLAKKKVLTPVHLICGALVYATTMGGIIWAALR